ncbi:MAG TPA: ribonuclease R [Thiotrichaceae bacterium]|nr:ribonuclease R [Thiotrichaceae bacterium]
MSKNTKKKSKYNPKAKSESSSKRKFDLPEREAIMEVLREAGRPLARKDLAEAFIIRDPEIRRALGHRLKAMTRDGQLIRNRRGSYGLIEKMDLIKGRVIGHPDGYGFVVPDEGGKDLFLSARQMRTILNGDRVLVRQVSVDKRGKREGSLVEVLERANHQLVGRYLEDKGVAYVIPDNKRISQNLLIPPNKKNKAKYGQYVVVEIIHQPEKHRQAIGKILSIIGDDLEGSMAVDLAMRSYELPFEWPDAVEKEIEGLNNKIVLDDLDNRKDIRELPLVTIDGADARDFDDAVYCEKEGNGWKLLVAIADVSHYVKKQNSLDDEARLRGTSVYFPDRVIPMLPEILSNGLCSLKPDVERYSLVCELNLDAKGKVKRTTFFKGLIKSSARLTYDEMQSIVVDKDDDARNKRGELVTHLDDLFQLYQLLHAERKKNGLIDFSSMESRFEFDDEGNIAAIHQVDRNEAHRLIEEMMLAANVAAGEFLQENDIFCMYRIHETPKVEKLENVRTLLSQLGLSLGGGEEPTSKDYAVLMKVIREREDTEMLETILLRSMPLAAYSIVNEGHFGLGFATYAHFTSPIRRYPDLMVHRAIEHITNGNTSETFQYSLQEMLELAEHCSMTERRAEEASRDAVQRLKCAFMKDKVGEVFEGMVSSVTAFGLFVVLDDIHIEGLIHISNLPVDYYHHDAITHTLRGERGGTVFKLGQRLKVLLTRVDLDERKIDFELQEEE